MITKNYLFDCHLEITVSDFSNSWNSPWWWLVYDFPSNATIPIFSTPAKLCVLVQLPGNCSPSLNFLFQFSINRFLGTADSDQSFENGPKLRRTVRPIKTFLIVPFYQTHHLESCHLQVHLIPVLVDSSKREIQILFREHAWSDFDFK